MIELDCITQDDYLAESSLIKDLELSENSIVSVIMKKSNNCGGMLSALQPFCCRDPKIAKKITIRLNFPVIL